MSHLSFKFLRIIELFKIGIFDTILSLDIDHFEKIEDCKINPPNHIRKPKDPCECPCNGANNFRNESVLILNQYRFDAEPLLLNSDGIFFDKYLKN